MPQKTLSYRRSIFSDQMLRFGLLRYANSNLLGPGSADSPDGTCDVFNDGAGWLTLMFDDGIDDGLKGAHSTFEDWFLGGSHEANAESTCRFVASIGWPKPYRVSSNQGVFGLVGKNGGFIAVLKVYDGSLTGEGFRVS